MTPNVAAAPATSSLFPLASRAFEVERIQRRNLAAGLLLSIALHASAFAIYLLLPPLQHPIEIGERERRGPYRPHDEGGIDLEKYGLPGSPGVAPKIPDVGAGQIVAVPDIAADPTKTFATQKQLAGGEVATDGDGTEAGTGSGSGEPEVGNDPIGDIEPEPPDFVPVEREPMLVRRVAPRYPEIAQRAGIEGKVTVKIWVTKEGKVREVRLVAGDSEMFNEAALEAARQFLFTPAYMNSGPVAVWVSVPFTFKLKN